MKRKNKGFTLVEVIVILVILAVLAAVLIPSLSTYIDKARDRQIIANARSAFVATQTLLSEEYAKSTSFGASGGSMDAHGAVTGASSVIKDTAIRDLAQLTNVSTFHYIYDIYAAITDFSYTENGRTVIWDKTTGNWTVDKDEDTSSGS